MLGCLLNFSIGVIFGAVVAGILISIDARYKRHAKETARIEIAEDRRLDVENKTEHRSHEQAGEDETEEQDETGEDETEEQDETGEDKTNECQNDVDANVKDTEMLDDTSKEGVDVLGGPSDTNESCGEKKPSCPT